MNRLISRPLLAATLAVVALILSGPASATPLVPAWGFSTNDVNYRAQGRAIGADAAGNIYVAGMFEGEIDLGDGYFSGPYPAGDDVFVAKFSPDGTLQWEVACGADGDDEVFDLVVTPGGDVAVVGATSGGKFEIPSGVTSILNGGDDAFLIGVTSGGTIVHLETWGGPGNDCAKSVAWGGGTNIIITGSFANTVEFVAGNPIASLGSSDYFLLSTFIGGGTAAAVGFGSTTVDIDPSICIDDDGDIFFAAPARGAMDLGTGTLTPNSIDLCLAKFPSVGAAASWATLFGGTTSADRAYATDVATDGTNVFVSGRIDGTIDLGVGSMTSNGSGDALVAAFKKDGTPVWSDHGGGVSADNTATIDYHDGTIVVSALPFGPSTFGGQNLPGQGSFDVVVMSYDVNGAILGLAYGGGPSTDQITGLVMTDDGVFGAGSHTRDATFGPLSFPGFSTSVEAFLIRFNDSAVDAPQVGPSGTVALALELGAPRPHPARGAVVLPYRGPAADADVRAAVYDLQGRRVAPLSVAGDGLAGTVRWDGLGASGEPVAAGVYFVQVTAGAETAQRRVVTIR